MPMPRILRGCEGDRRFIMGEVPLYSLSKKLICLDPGRCLVAQPPRIPSHRGASLTRKRTPLEPYRRHTPRVLGES